MNKSTSKNDDDEDEDDDEDDLMICSTCFGNFQVCFV